MGRSHSVLLLQPLGGQIARIPEDANAITARHAPWTAHCIGEWETPEETEAELAWVRAWADVIAPFRMAGVPMTFSADTGDETGARDLRRREVRAPRRAEGQVRPGEPLPAEPEHQAELGSG